MHRRWDEKERKLPGDEPVDNCSSSRGPEEYVHEGSLGGSGALLRGAGRDVARGAGAGRRAVRADRHAAEERRWDGYRADRGRLSLGYEGVPARRAAL